MTRRAPHVVFVQDPGQTVGEVAIIGSHIVKSEKNHSKAVVHQLLRGLKTVRDAITEVDMHEEGVPFPVPGHDEIKREGKVPAVYGTVCGHLVQVCLSGAKAADGVFGDFKGQLLRLLGEIAVFPTLRDIQHLCPGQEGRDILPDKDLGNHENQLLYFALFFVRRRGRLGIVFPCNPGFLYHFLRIS